MDVTARLRAIVRPQGGRAPVELRPPSASRELTYEPDDGRRHEATLDLGRVADAVGGRLLSNSFGQCLAVDRRYESDRRHGDLHIGDCALQDCTSLRLLDPALNLPRGPGPTPPAGREAEGPGALSESALPVHNPLFIDLETTGLSGGAGTVAFLIGCGYFDCGAFQVRQFLLTSYSAERALLAAATELFETADLIVTYNGKTFDVPVMETRWAFHRMRGALDHLPHFDMLHPARRLWRSRAQASDEGGCRLSTLERLLFNMRRVGDVDGFEIPGRFFQFLRSGDPRPLEPVLEHNRLDLVSLAAVTSRALRLAAAGEAACRDATEALALGRVLERAGSIDRAEACYRRAAAAQCVATRAEACYRLGIRCRRERRFGEAAAWWREILALTGPSSRRRDPALGALHRFAVEALAIHQEHRVRDLDAARELALLALEGEEQAKRGDGMRHRLARLERKLGQKKRTGSGDPALQLGFN